MPAIGIFFDNALKEDAFKVRKGADTRKVIRGLVGLAGFPGFDARNLADFTVEGTNRDHRYERRSKSHCCDAAISIYRRLRIPKDSTNRHAMLFHVEVYGLADVIQHQELRGVAETRLGASVAENWKAPAFIAAIQSV